MERIAKLLQIEFDRLGADPRTPNFIRKIIEKKSGQARYLDISAGHYSRLLNGKTPMTFPLAQRIAKRLCKNDEPGQKKLVRQLMEL